MIKVQEFFDFIKVWYEIEQLKQQNADLVAALQALGVTPYDYYCFCPPEMGFAHSGDHTGECRDAQQALAKAKAE